ncbi:hypothetical protein N9J30_00370 [Gammaproteobacteria bacterium]|nr:hypothetical protein [Gammaproteobacteria bacterium]
MAYASGAGGQGPLTVQPDAVITNQNGQIMVYDSGGNLAPGGMYQPPPDVAPVPDPSPGPVPPAAAGSGVEIESYGAYALYRMDDGSFRVGSASGEQIKDYGGSVYNGGDIVAADAFNNSMAVLFSSGHLWYVDGTWTKAPTGPGGRDTENLSADDMTAYFFSDSPPNGYTVGGIPAPAPVPDPAPLPVVPPSGGSDSGVELESYGAYSLYKMDDGTFRVNSETGEQIKDYGGSVYRGNDIVAVDDFNGSRAVLFGGGHIWYVDGSWTKAPTGPNGNDTANIEPSEMPTYFFSNNPPPIYDEGATPAPIPPVTNPGDDGSFSDNGDALESFGAFSLYRMNDNTFRVGSPDGPLVRDYGGSVYSGGDIVASENFNGSKAVLFSSGHVWYVDDNWTKAPVGPGGRDTENLSSRDMVLYFSSDAPPASYESGDDASPIDAPIAPPPADNDAPAATGFELEGFGSFSLYRMDDNTFRIDSLTGPRVREHGGSVYRGGDVVAVDYFNGSSKAVLFGSGHLWYVDENWTKAPVGPDGRDTENLSTGDMARYFYSNTPPVMYAPVEDDIPRVPPSSGNPGEDQDYSNEGFLVEELGSYPLYGMTDGTYRIGSLEGELIKDYGGSVWRGGAIVAADEFNGAKAVVFDGGHVWYVDDTWTKAPVGPSGKDTEQLTFSEVNTYFYNAAPPADFGSPVIGQPVERPPARDYLTEGRLAEEFGDWPLYRMNDGTYRTGSLDGPLIKDYGGSVWQGGTIVAADKFNGALAVVFEGGHLWYVNSNWTKAQVGPQGRDTENLTIPQLANYFYNENPPLFFDNDEFVTSPPAPEPPVDGGSPATTGTVIESFGSYSLYRMGDGTYRVNSLEGEQIKDAGGQVWTGGGVVAVDDINGVRTIAFADGNVWYADVSWTKANVGPEGKSADAFTDEEISEYFFDSGASVVEPEEPDEIIPPTAGLDPAEFNYLYSSSTGKELVNRLIAVGVERILSNISLEQVERIFEKFGDDIDFLNFAETPDEPQVEFESEMWTLSLLPTGVYQVEPAGGGPISIISNSNGSPTLDSVVAVTTSNFVNMIAFEGGRVWYADSNWMQAPLGPNGISTATFSASDINAVFFGENEFSETPVPEKPLEDEDDNLNEPPTEDVPDVPVEVPADDLPLDEEDPVDEPGEPGSGLPEEEFLFFFESETGLEIVTKIQETDLNRLSFLISDEQVAQIFTKFGEDPGWQAFVASIQGGDRTASELTIEEETETVYEIELVGTTSESYPDYVI